MLEFLKKEWKFFLGLLLVVTVLTIGYYEYRSSRSIPMATVPTVNYAEMAKAMQGLNKSQPEIQRITDTIVRETQGAPQYIYITKDQTQADLKAKEISKTDFVVKEPVNEITNKYYGIRTTRPWGISMGLGYESGKTYIPIEIQREYRLDKTVSLEIHVKPFRDSKITGGEIKFGWKLK